jgi:HEAT repeat protein
MATTTLGSKLRLKHVWWLVVPLAMVLAMLTALVVGTKLNLGSRSFGLSIQTLMPNGPFHAEGFFIHTGWDGPTGSFSTGDIYGLKLGNRLLLLDIVDDPIAAAKRKLPATVDELVTALDSRDGWLRLCALERLAELGAAAVPAIPALVKRIENGDEQAADTLSAVGKSSPDKAVPLLMEALGNSSVDVRWRVAELLGEIGPPASNAIPVLTDRLDDPEPKVVGHAAIALRKIGGVVTNAVTVVRRLLNHHDPEVRAFAAVALAELGADASVALPDLVHLLDDSDAQVRTMASRTIGVIGSGVQPVNMAGGSTAITKLKALAQTKDVSAQWALDALSTMGPEAASILAEIYRTADGQRRLSAARALMKLGSSAGDALPVLMADLSSTNAGRAHLTAQIVGHLGDSGRAALPQLAALLKHPDVRVRVRAAEAIWKLDGRTNDVLPVLLAALQDDSLHRGGGRRFAAEALGQMGAVAEDAVPLLEALLNDRQSGIRYAAAVSLKKITGAKEDSGNGRQGGRGGEPR